MPQSAFQHALALHRQGRLEEAARAYGAILAASPGHPDALLHLGVLRLGQQRPAEAEALLRRAVQAAPDRAEAAANLGAALQAAGRCAEAVGHYLRALRLRPGFADAGFGLAACLQALGQEAEAVGCYEAVLEAEPAHPEASFGLAGLLARLGRTEAAIARYRAALEADPDFAEASHGLGLLLAATGQAEEAIGCFRRALDVDPAYPEARLALGQVLLRLELDVEAEEAFRAALAQNPRCAAARLGIALLLCRRRQDAAALPHFEAVLAARPGDAEAMVGKATALGRLGRHAEAIALCRAASALQPELAAAPAVLGFNLAQAGEMAEAEVAARRAMALAPGRPEFCFNLVQVATIRRGDPVIAALEAMLPRAGALAPRERSWLHFALGKALEDTGEPERAFRHLLEANAAHRRLVAYDEGQALGAMERMRAIFTADLLAARRECGDPSEVPVFVTGAPRSGTTLVEQILASHGQVFGAGERQEMSQAAAALPGFPGAVRSLPAAELRRAGAAYVAALRALAPGAARIVDKGLGNVLFAGLVHLILPRARIVQVTRDPVDTCLSCFSKLFAEGQDFTYDLGELGRHHRAQQRLMAHWRAVLPAGTLLDVAYEELVEDPEGQARRILAHCGLPWDPACLEFHRTARPVRTASLAQVRRPLYRSAIGRWRPDAATLRPLLEGLGTAG